MEKEFNELLSVMKKADGNYSNEAFIMDDDKDINDCLIKLHLRLIAGNDNPNLNMYEEQFIRAYRKLSKEQKDKFKKKFNTIMMKQKEINERNKIEGKIIGDKE